MKLQNSLMSRVCSVMLGAVLFLQMGWGDTHSLCAQTSDPVDLSIQLQPIVSQAQALSLSTLGVDRRGQGQQVAILIIANNTARTQSNLYMHIVVENTNAGVIAELDQREGSPFKLDPNEIVRATNNDLQMGLPGIEASLHFAGGLTNAGEDFINSLKGQTRLPNDVYTLTLEIYQGHNRLNGGTRVASASASVGEEPMTNVQDVFINSPGGEVGSGVEFVINNRQPQFDWSGGETSTYRLVVVEAAENESPESLLSSARSTQPVMVDGQNVGNTLLDFEMADVKLSSSSFRYPSSGVRQLKPGKEYYWQVITLVQTPDGEQEIDSEIWSFSIAERQNRQTSADQQDLQMSEQTRQALRNLLGSRQFSMLTDKNVDLQSVVIDGQRYSGQAMIQQIKQFIERVRRGEITIVDQ